MRVLLALILFVGLNISFAEEEKLEKVKIPEDIIKQLDIKVEKIEKRSLKITKKYPAVVKDDLTLSEAIYSPVEGLIKYLFVKEGDKVKKGQKLALIYSPKIIQIQSQFFLANVQLNSSKQIFEREKQLYESKVIPYSRYFEAKIKFENAAGKVEALKRTLSAFGELEDGLLVLRAGMDGYISQQNVVLGDSVNLGKQIFRIHSHERLWVVAFVPVEDSTMFKKRLKLKIISPIGTTYGVVDFISHKVDPDTKRNEIRIIADNKNETLKPNMFVDVILYKKLTEDLYIPVSAIVFQEDKTLAFVEENGYFYPVEIKIGKRIGDYYQVLAGLKEGQNVVVEGTVHLKAKFFGEAEEE